MEQQANKKLTWPPPLVVAEDFDISLINSLLSEIKSVSCHRISSTLKNASEEKLRSGDIKQACAIQLLAGASDIYLKTSDEGVTWSTIMTGPDGRTPLPEDFKGEQNQVLPEIAAAIHHPGLKARLEDIAWTNDRKLGKSANNAIQAYCECAENLLNEKSPPELEHLASSIHESLGYIHRALVLGYITQRRRMQPRRTLECFSSLYKAAKSYNNVGVLLMVARVALRYKIIDDLDIATDLDLTSTIHSTSCSPTVIQSSLDLAAHLYGKCSLDEKKRECQLKSVDQILLMRQQVQGASAEAHWVQTAIFALREIKGTELRRKELRRELRDLQEDSLAQMAEFSIPIDLKDQIEGTTKKFGELDLSTSLLVLAHLSHSRSVEKLREEAVQNSNRSAFKSMLGAKHVDNDGKAVAITEGFSPDQTPSENWIKTKINETERIRRYIFVSGAFEAARSIINQQFNVNEEHLAFIVAHSPFVKEEQAAVMSLGFTRLLQGDFRSAVHLLVPQLEPSLRYLLRSAGHDPNIEFDDSTEENVGLQALMGRLRTHLETIMTPEIVLEIDLVFHHKTGPSLGSGPFTRLGGL